MRDPSLPLKRAIHVRGSLAVLLAGAVLLAAAGGAHAYEPFANGSPDGTPQQPRYPVPMPQARSNSAEWVVMAVGGTVISLAGLALSVPGSLGYVIDGAPFDWESRTHLRTCCIEQAILTPSFVAMAGGGLMLGFGADRARHRDWDKTTAEESLITDRNGLIIGGTLLGTATALFVISGILMRAIYSEVIEYSGRYELTASGERMVYASWGTLALSLLLAFPGGTTTGVYLNRYLQSRSTSATAQVPLQLMFTPTLSRDVYGLQASGRF